jgi:hypothetical protein
MPRKIKAWLKRNKLTTDETDYTVVIESSGSATVRDIIDGLVKEGMELKPETVLDVITRFNRKCLELLLQGCNINTGMVHMRLVAKGVVRGKKWDSEHNRLYVSITQGAEMRAAVADTTVEIMGESPDPLVLYSVAAVPKGKTDDFKLKRGFNAELKGEFIKIVGNDTCGIYFRNVDTAKEIKLEPEYIPINERSRVLIIVPATMEPGMYELRVTTQFSTNKLLKDPRSISLPYIIEIV